MIPIDLSSSERAYYICTDHELIDGGYLVARRHGHIPIARLQRLQELIRDLSILGYLELDLALECAVAGRFDVELAAKLFFLLAKTVPLLIGLQMSLISCCTLT